MLYGLQTGGTEVISITLLQFNEALFIFETSWMMKQHSTALMSQTRSVDIANEMNKAIDEVKLKNVQPPALREKRVGSVVALFKC